MSDLTVCDKCRAEIEPRQSPLTDEPDQLGGYLDHLADKHDYRWNENGQLTKE